MPPPTPTVQPGLGSHLQPSAMPRASGSGLELCPARLCSARASCPGLRLVGPPSGLSPCPLRTRLLSFAWQPTGEDGEAQAGDGPAAGGKVVSKGQSLQNGLHAEGQGGEGVLAPPRKELQPRRAALGAVPSKGPSPAPGPVAAVPKPAETPRPEAPKAAKPSCPEKSPKDPHPRGSPPAPAPTPRKDLQRSSKIPAKEGDAPKGTGPESTKEEGAPPSHEEPPAKERAKREPGLAGKEPERMKKDVEGGKKEPREIKKLGKTATKSEGLKGKPGEIQEKSEDVVKEVRKAKEEPGEGKETPGESKETGESMDKEQVTCPRTCQAVTPCLGPLMPFFWFHAALPVRVGSAGGWGKVSPRAAREGQGFWLEVFCPWGKCSLSSSVFHCFLHDSPLSSPQAPRDVWYEAEKVWLIQQDGFTLGNLPSSALTSQHRR